MDWSSDVCSSDLDTYNAGVLSSPTGDGTFAGRHTADLLAQSARLGWMPTMPTFDRNPLDLADEAKAAAPEDPAGYVAARSEERRVGKGCVRSCRVRCAPYHSKKKKPKPKK